MTQEEGKNAHPNRRAIVIGAGIVGVCVAWHLQRRGFQVTILDRKPPGEETSWGNAGLIQNLPPSRFPRGALNRARIALNLKNDVRYGLSGLAEYWYGLYVYWRSSMEGTFDRIVREYATLANHCTEEHEMMVKASRSESLIRRNGFLEVFKSRSLVDLEGSAKNQRSLGVAVDVVPTQGLGQLEPSIRTEGCTGAFFFTETWQATDPGALVKAYAGNFVAKGGSVVQATVNAIMPPVSGDETKQWTVSTSAGRYEAPLVVVAAGPWSCELLKPLGYWFPFFPLRGYNTHFHLAEGATLNHPVVDAENGFALSPMRHGVRLTTGGEVTAMSAPPNEKQLRASEQIARKLLPLGEQASKVWFGSRPCIADMKPIIGEAPQHPGLWFCFGHGANGLTLGPVSGRLLSELITRDKPFVDPTPFSAQRFSSP